MNNFDEPIVDCARELLALMSSEIPESEIQGPAMHC